MSRRNASKLALVACFFTFWLVVLNGCSLLRQEQYIVYAVGDPGSRDIVVSQWDGSDQRVIINNPADDFSPIWSPDHSRIAFLSNRDGNVELYIARADGSSQMRVTNTDVAESQPTWSPDGTRLAYVSPDFQGRPRVYWLKLSDLQPHRLLFEDSQSEVDPAWSPQGTWIAYASLDPQGKSQGLFLRNPDGVNRIQITSSPDRNPVWSPDGSKLAFVSTRDGNEEIYVIKVNQDGPVGDVIRLTADAGADFDPQWSPDGKRVAFISDRNGNRDIFVVNDKGENLTELTKNQIEESDFVWGPNGKIVFESRPADKEELYVMTPGGAQSRLSEPGVSASQPDW